jgi:AcrR family transcriptional regulator
MAARPERVAAEEVKQRMLDAGRQLALEAGVALTIEHLRLEEVIQRARVPRSSVYRLWPYREEYIDDLLCYMAGPGSFFVDRPVLDPDTFTVAGKVLTDNPHLFATPEGRRALVCEVVRITATRNYDDLSASAPWRLHMALLATLGSTRSGAARRRIAAALEASQLRSRESIAALLRFLADALGLRLKAPGYTYDHLQMAGGLLVQAMALRNIQVQAVLAEPETDPAEAGEPDSGTRHDAAGGGEAGPGEPDLTDARYVDGLLNAPIPGPGLNGQTAPWTLVTYAYLGLVDAFLEPDPDFIPPAPPAAS